MEGRNCSHHSDARQRKPPGAKEPLRAEFPDLLFIEDIFARYDGRLTFNELQLMLLANCDHLLAVQGGNSVVSPPTPVVGTPLLAEVPMVLPLATLAKPARFC